MGHETIQSCVEKVFIQLFGYYFLVIWHLRAMRHTSAQWKIEKFTSESFLHIKSCVVSHTISLQMVAQYESAHYLSGISNL